MVSEGLTFDDYNTYLFDGNTINRGQMLFENKKHEENIDHLFNTASEIVKADKLHLFLLSGGTQIDDNEYLGNLENGTKLTVCTKEQIQKLLIYFELKRYLSLKNISNPLNIDYFV